MPLRRPLLSQAAQLQHILRLSFRPSLVGSFFHPRHNFHSSDAIAAEEFTHYDTLNLSRTATTAEIKRRYYELSKTHHPDRNPKDPGAAGRFARISDAYAVIGNAMKREKYDRDISRIYGIKLQRATGPVGGRPASGLSRRRSQFYGPPPSFYKTGGFGNVGRATRTSQSGGNSKNGLGGFGIGGTQSGRNDDVPHFDFERHRAQQERRRRPMSQAEFDFATSGIFVPMLGVASLLIVAIAIVSRDSKSVKKQSNDASQ